MKSAIAISDHKIVSFVFRSLGDNGVIRVLLTLAQGLIERGWQVDIVVLKAEGKGLNWVPVGARIVELNTSVHVRGFHKVLYLLYLIRYLRQVQPTAMICGDGINWASIAKQIARVQTQVIVTSHNCLSDYLRYKSAEFRHSFTGLLLRRFLWFYAWADQIVPVSQGIADDLMKMSSRPLKRMRVIYNPVVTPQILAKAQEEIAHPWFAAREPPVIIAVGRFQLQKDFPTLIRAFALVQKHLPARLMILGEGQDRPQLKALIDQLGLTDTVALPGFVENPYAFMAKAAVFVLSSIHEGLPTVLIEAMAVGTPVISTDCPSGPAEILDYGKYGLLVPVGNVESLANAIVQTLNHPTDKEELRQQAQKFSYQAAVDSYLEILK